MTGFAWPAALLAAAIVPVLAGWLTFERRRRQRVPTLAVFGGVPALVSGGVAPVLALVGLTALWLAVARPFTTADATDSPQARNLILVLDVSASMAESGPDPARAAAAHAAVARFVQARRNDRLGLVVFARQVLVVAPLTRDHRSLLSLAGAMQPGDLGPGTAIGDALAVALERLASSSGVGGVVLVSDGEHNAGFVDPLTAASAAHSRGVPVDAVVVGSSHAGFDQMAGIAAATGGHVIHAQDLSGLDRAFRELSRLQPASDTTIRAHQVSHAHIPGMAAALLLTGAVAVELAARRVWA